MKEGKLSSKSFARLTNSCRDSVDLPGSRQRIADTAVVGPDTRRCTVGTADKLPCFERQDKHFQAAMELLHPVHPINIQSYILLIKLLTTKLTLAVAICFSIASASSIFPNER